MRKLKNPRLKPLQDQGPERSGWWSKKNNPQHSAPHAAPTARTPSPHPQGVSYNATPYQAPQGTPTPPYTATRPAEHAARRAAPTAAPYPPQSLNFVDHSAEVLSLLKKVAQKQSHLEQELKFIKNYLENL